MFAFGENPGIDSRDQSTDVDSSDAFGEEDDYSGASDFDEDNITREQRRKEFDQLCRQNRFGEAPSISSDDSDSDDSFACDHPENKSRFIVSDESERMRPASHGVHEANSGANDTRFLSYHPGAEVVEFVGKAPDGPCGLVACDKSLSLSLNPIPKCLKLQSDAKDVEYKRCGSDSSLAVGSKRVNKSPVKNPTPPVTDIQTGSDVNGLNLLCQQQRQWLDELRTEMFRSKEEWQRELRLLTHKLMLSEGEKRHFDEQSRALRQRLSDEQLKIASLEQQLRDETRHSQRLAEDKIQCERDAIAAREEANSLQDQLISLTRTSGLYQERNAMAEQWTSERTSLLNQVENLRMQLADRQNYIERSEESMRQMEERYRQALSENEQMVADRRRVELERDRLSRDLELAHTEARLAVASSNNSDMAKTSTPRVTQFNHVELTGCDASPLVSSSPRFLGSESMLKIELAKALAANRDNVEKIRMLESQIASVMRNNSSRGSKAESDELNRISEELNDMIKDRDNLKTKLSDILEENRRLSSKLRDFVAEADREKQTAIESARNACLRLHDDAKRSLLEVHRHEIDELQKKHEVAITQLLVEMRGLSAQVDDAKASYLQACSEKAEAEETIRREYDAKLGELRSLLACETSALQEKLSIKEKQLEANRVTFQKALRLAMSQINSSIEATANSFRNQVVAISAKLAALYGRFDTLSVAFNRLSFHLFSNKQHSSNENQQDDQSIPDAVVQLRTLFLETAQRMREVYVAHSKASEDRNRRLLAALAKASQQAQHQNQQSQSRRPLAVRNEVVQHHK